MLDCGIIRARCRDLSTLKRRRHNGDDSRGGQVSGNSRREACLLPGSTPLCREAKDRDRKRGKFPGAKQIADKLCWPEMSRFGGWGSGQLLRVSHDLPEDGHTQRGERDGRGRVLWLGGRESRSVRATENPGRRNNLRRSLDHPIGDLLERREDVSRVGAGANHSEEHRVGIAVLAEPGTVPWRGGVGGLCFSVSASTLQNNGNWHSFSSVDLLVCQQTRCSQSTQVGRVTEARRRRTQVADETEP